MKKVPFVTLEKLQEITSQFPTPFHLYDEKGIRENAKAVKEAFSWNPGFREYFAVKATPNPSILKILQEYGCGTDCSSATPANNANCCIFFINSSAVHFVQLTTLSFVIETIVCAALFLAFSSA